MSIQTTCPDCKGSGRQARLLDPPDPTSEVDGPCGRCEENGEIEHPHAQKITGLRQLADFLEEHPELPTGFHSQARMGIFASGLTDDAQREAFATASELLGETEVGTMYVIARRLFAGCVELEVFADPKVVAERVEVPTTTVKYRLPRVAA